MNFNQITLIGHITRDLELKVSQSGKDFCQFGIAVNDRYGDKAETMFIDCVCWDKTADTLCKYCQKGSNILVTGKLTLDKWQDKEGNNRSAHRVRVTNIQFCNRMQDDNAPKQSAPLPRPVADANGRYKAPSPTAYQTDDNPDDIPF